MGSGAKIVVLPGDGIGPEVADAAQTVLRAVAERLAELFQLLDGASNRRLMTGSGESWRIVVLHPVLHHQALVDRCKELGQSAS